MNGLHQNKHLQNIGEQGSNALGSFLCIVLAGIVVLFVCSDATQQVSQAVHHHNRDVDVLAWLGVK